MQKLFIWLQQHTSRDSVRSFLEDKKNKKSRFVGGATRVRTRIDLGTKKKSYYVVQIESTAAVTKINEL